MVPVSRFLSVWLAHPWWVRLSAAASVPKVIKKVPPEFPREAAQQSISAGSVKAKMNIDAEGKVTNYVSIKEDIAALRALLDKHQLDSVPPEGPGEVVLYGRISGTIVVRRVP